MRQGKKHLEISFASDTGGLLLWVVKKLTGKDLDNESMKNNPCYAENVYNTFAYIWED